MNLAVLRAEAVKRRRPIPRPNNLIGVIKSIPDMRILMAEEHIEFPIVIRFKPEVLDDEQKVKKLSELYSLLSKAKRKSGKGEEGKMLFVYRS